MTEETAGMLVTAITVGAFLLWAVRKRQRIEAQRKAAEELEQDDS
jgi:hypothetical protein